MDSDYLSPLLFNLSTQLRGPMSNLYAAISHLAPKDQRTSDPKLDDQAAFLDQSYYQLLRLMNNLNAFQSLNESAHLLNQDIVAPVNSVFERVNGFAWHQHLTLRFLCPMEHHICAFSLEGIQQILWQLFSNAFKFTPSGGTITLELARSHGEILLSVANTGPGIPPEDRETLFRRWQCGKMAVPPHGAGLGLAICQGIARQHNGTLTLDESVSKGCRFVFAMPDHKSKISYISDIQPDYAGGFDPYLVALSDALPHTAFCAF